MPNRLDVGALRQALILPEQCILGAGGSSTSADLWFIGPSTFDLRDAVELLKQKTGKGSMKYNKENITSTFFGKNLEQGQSWFCIEIFPEGVETKQLQNFIDELAKRIAYTPLNLGTPPNIEESSTGKKQGASWMPLWLRGILGKD